MQLAAAAPPVTVTLAEPRPLGYKFHDFGNGAEVIEVKPGSQAERAGRVVAGCRLVAIEAGGASHNVDGMAYESVLPILKQGARP
eukprot:COSAG04_NODE_21188_length_378_cov_1.021505_1_plen_84_part_01